MKRKDIVNHYVEMIWKNEGTLSTESLSEWLQGLYKTAYTMGKRQGRRSAEKEKEGISVP